MLKWKMNQPFFKTNCYLKPENKGTKMMPEPRVKEQIPKLCRKTVITCRTFFQEGGHPSVYGIGNTLGIKIYEC